MRKSEIFERLSGRGGMPAPSRIALKIMQVYRDSSSSLSEISEMIETDPELSSSLLKYADLTLMFPADHTLTVKRVAVKLGVKTVANLALCLSLLTRYKTGSCSRFDYKLFWARSLARATAARSLVHVADDLDPDELFVMSLLATIGSLALASLFPEEYGIILSEWLDAQSLLLREDEQFGINRVELSALLLHSWELPEHFASAVVHSHDYLNNEPVEVNDRILRLASIIADICMLEAPLNSKTTEAETIAHTFGLTPATFGQLFDTIVEKWQQWGRNLQVPTHDFPLYRQIKEMDRREKTPLSVNHYEVDRLQVLVADDDPMALLTLSRLLEKQNKLVYTADDGEKAMALALKHQPHMIITDWRMPKINGIALCNLLRRSNATKHVYIIMLTGKESADELVEALEAGADDFVAKPFITKVLEARIRSGDRIIRYQQMINHDREVIQNYAARLAAANRRFENLAMTDVLTGLPNRRSALSRLKEIVSECKRHQEPLCCIMIDIDHFKNVNDNYGHDAGDKVLQEIAHIFCSSARSYDIVSRIGGEEFLVICAHGDLGDSHQLAERLRKAVAAHQVEHEGAVIRTTISLGVASWHEKMTDGEEMIKAADRALYRAKQLGRNRVELDRPSDANG